MAIMTDGLTIDARRRAVTALVTVLVLAGVALFSWRVYHFAALMRSGEITDADLSFLQKMTPGQPVAAPAAEELADVITNDDPSLGNKDAPVTIVEFADFGCPYSREESFVIRSIAAQFPDTVRIVYRDFPIEELHPGAEAAAEAAECAAEQNRFWDYHDKLYANQGAFSEDALIRYAEELNLSVGQFKRCLLSDRNVPEVRADYDAGLKAGVAGTPTFYFEGVQVPGAIPEDILKKLIEWYANN